MDTDPELSDAPVPHHLGRRQRDVAVAGWSSFLTACAGALLLFAWLDPQVIAETTDLPFPSDRMAGYALGFFFLWSVSAASAVLTLFLIRTRHGHPPPQDGVS